MTDEPSEKLNRWVVVQYKWSKIPHQLPRISFPTHAQNWIYIVSPHLLKTNCTLQPWANTCITQNFPKPMQEPISKGNLEIINLRRLNEVYLALLLIWLQLIVTDRSIFHKQPWETWPCSSRGSRSTGGFGIMDLKYEIIRKAEHKCLTAFVCQHLLIIILQETRPDVSKHPGPVT